MRNSFSLGSFFGIEIRVDASWLIVLSLVVWLLSTHYFPMSYPDWAPEATLALAFLTAVLFGLSVVAHELAHSLVSGRLGLRVPRITLFIFGGMAEISREPERPRDEFLIAIAGPLASLALALAFGALVLGGPAFGPLGLPLAALGQWLAVVNLGLALFNLLPGLPLDGGRILRAAIWGFSRNYQTATRIAGVVGRLIAMALVFWGFWQVAQGRWADGLWVASIGWFLAQAASRSMAGGGLRHLLAGHTARDVMLTDGPRVSPVMTVQTLVDEVMGSSGRRGFLVTGGNRVIGLITLKEIQAVPREKWRVTTVGTAMILLKDLQTASPDLPLSEVVERLATGVDPLPIVEAGQLVGMVARDSVSTFLRSGGKPVEGRSAP